MNKQSILFEKIEEIDLSEYEEEIVELVTTPMPVECKSGELKELWY